MSGTELVNKIAEHLRRYVVFPSSSQPLALALWVIHTYAIEAADTTPYPLITSPEKRSGKTRLLEVLELLVARAWRLAGASEAVLFRKIEKDTPTLLLDELDAVFGTYAEKTEPIRAVINAGNRRGGSVARCVPPSHDVKDFHVFCPKALAGIDTGRLPETIRDRAIVIGLHRKAGEPVERLRYRRARAEAQEIVTAIEKWVEQNLEKLDGAEPDLPEELNDRAAEGWEPLLAIADAVGAPIADTARRAAVALSSEGDIEDDSFGIQLLADLRAVWNEQEESDALKSEFLCSALKHLEERPWGGWGKGRPNPGLNMRDLARLLRPYGIKPKTIRLDGATAKGYKREQLADTWQRYLPEDPSAPRSHPSPPAPEDDEEAAADATRNEPPGESEVSCDDRMEGLTERDPQEARPGWQVEL
jgi:hypothetical protein